jgi:hypothetical protein
MNQCEGERSDDGSASKVAAEEYTWIPSDNWCYRFLKCNMGYSLRMITGKRVTQSQLQEQQKLFKMLQYLLAKDIADGVAPECMFMSDEFGLSLFPQDSFTWAPKVSKEVNVDIYDDKRQYTANIGHNAAGQCVAFQVIFDGKDIEKSAPMAQIRSLGLDKTYPRWIPGVSENHWSNLDQKKNLINAFAEHVRAYATDKVGKGLLMEQDSATVPWTCILDCWKVNVCKEFKQWMADTHPNCRLRYIPAGMTGDVQINDAFLHGPFKKWVRALAEAWYQTAFTANLAKLKQQK